MSDALLILFPSPKTIAIVFSILHFLRVCKNKLAVNELDML